MQIPTGDKLLRRVAEVLRSAFRAEDVVARIGGDEFAALMPATDETAAAQTMERIQTLINLNNKYYRGPVLSLSVGVALAVRGQSLTEAQRLADDRMYAEKRAHHAAARR
ncbi:MAG: GGDEF domain-containing protein [Chloroflexi bacterium]|nr:GGDEF domain-containing protein [Chloroflexota bacterium]